ncbi:hypothetical protein SLEP1_g30060 [Rubroshorea leprosula]|uniref:Uncharacterized protein n=1 Tax=Rubroshorea leprosula TaxID=152421 RepID=A0AAV5K9Q1_9ROSI|nr:hypothetical protein SLEP1_g30060 [Rubroshorea leprosula]
MKQLRGGIRRKDEIIHVIWHQIIIPIGQPMESTTNNHTSAGVLNSIYFM